MVFTPLLAQAGDHSFQVEGKAGCLEGSLMVPLKPRLSWIALVGHPHSLQGGTMNNKVVTTLARLFRDFNIPSLRFNFRGVGKSQGKYDEGLAESQDMLDLLDLYQKELPQAVPLFAGFSFGSYVAYRAAALSSSAKALISVAPPIHHYSYEEFSLKAPWWIAQGEQDEVVPYDLVSTFAKAYAPPIPLLSFPHAGHFFHGQLLTLKTSLTEALEPLLGPLS